MKAACRTHLNHKKEKHDERTLLGHASVLVDILGRDVRALVYAGDAGA